MRMKAQDIMDLGMYIIIFSIIGARLFYILTDYKYFTRHPLEIFVINKGGLVFFGGLAGAVISAWVVVKKRKLSAVKVADLFMIYLPLGQAVGRIGCYLNGCCYGVPTDSMLGVKFPIDSFVSCHYGASQLVHPAQLYSSAADLFIYMILRVRAQYQKYDGQIVLYYMLLYGGARFLLEYYRADNEVIYCGLNMPQLISFGIILFALVFGALCKNWNSMK